MSTKQTAAQRLDAMEANMAAILAALNAKDDTPAAKDDRPNVKARSTAKRRVAETTAKAKAAGKVREVPAKATDPTAHRFTVGDDEDAREYEVWSRYGVRVMPVLANGSRAKSWPVAWLLDLLRDEDALDEFVTELEAYAADEVEA